MSKDVQLKNNQQQDLDVVTTPSQVMHDGLSLEEQLKGEKQFSPVIIQETCMSKLGQGSNLDISSDVKNGYLSDATLKGRTLVNLYPKREPVGVSTNFNTSRVELVHPTAVNQKYIFSFVVSNVSLDSNERIKMNIRGDTVEGVYTTTSLETGKNPLTIDKNGRYSFIWVEPINSFKNILIGVSGSENVGNPNFIISDIMIVPYQEGMENLDLPYFEGMTNVKNPTVQNVGKNLFHIDGKEVYSENNLHQIHNNEVIMENTTYGYYNCGIKYFNLKPNKKYTISYDSEILSGTPYVIVLVQDEQRNSLNDNGNTFTTPSNGKIQIKFYSGSSNKMGKIRYYNIQIEEGSTATSYEPYKTNILSLPNIELRSLPNEVCDEVNLIGGVETQRIHQITFNGSEGWSIYSEWETETEYAFYSSYSNVYPHAKFNYSSVHCDTYPNKSYADFKNGVLREGVIMYGGGEGTNNKPVCSLQLHISKTKLSEGTVTALKQYLQQNPITIQYELAEPIVTTIEPLQTPFAYENGHIILSSDELAPVLEYKLPTSISSSVSQVERVMMNHQKRLSRLEAQVQRFRLESAYKRTKLRYDYLYN